MSRGGVIGGAVMLVAITCSTGTARAQDDSKLRLVVTRQAGTEDCPDALALRARVAELLLGDPFDSRGQATLECTTSRRDGAYVARLVLSDPDGARVGERELTAAGDSCTPLVDLLELALATAASGYAQARQASAIPQDPGPREVSTARRLTGPLEPPEDEPATPVARFPVFMAIGARVGVDSEGSPLAAGALAVGSRRRWLSVQLELLLFSRRTSRRASGTDVSVRAGSANLATCGHRGAVSACVVAGTGWVRGEGSKLMFARKPVTPSVEVGGRLRWDVALPARFVARASADWMGAATTTRFTIGEEVVWETPAYAAFFGISLIRRFR